MREKGSLSTFRILLAIIVAVTALVILGITLGDKSLTFCYGTITIVESGTSCPSPEPSR